jgi:hypothetical protein
MERRQYPRLDIRYPAELVVADRSTVAVLATNLSVSGLSLIVDHATALGIAPGGLAAGPRGGPAVEVRLTLPLRDGTHVKVEATCRVRGLRRAAMDEHHLGLEYETFHGHGYRALEAFVDDWMTYADET